ncbi:hypothetical protein [Micromonospora sp. NPDC049282]|uniref:hypothetical protein n=1 Tax=Micromonospora sp. NPDC049282 TaxID=3364269 RepID=UPI0037228AEB
MTLRSPGARDRSRKAFLVMLGWHGAVVVAYGLLVVATPAGGDSPRPAMLRFGLAAVLPALLVALLVSLLALRLLRDRVRSAALAGTVAATPALLLGAVLAAMVAR